MLQRLFVLFAVLVSLATAAGRADILNNNNGEFFLVEGGGYIHDDYTSHFIDMDINWGALCNINAAAALDDNPKPMLRLMNPTGSFYGFGIKLRKSQTIASVYAFAAEGIKFKYGQTLQGYIAIGDSLNYSDNPVCATIFDSGYYTCEQPLTG